MKKCGFPKFLKGLSEEYESFTTLVKVSKEEEMLEEIKRDLIYFDIEKVQKISEFILYNK